MASHISHLHQQASNRDINSRYGISWYSLWKLFRSSQASDEDPRIISKQQPTEESLICSQLSEMVREAQLCLLLQSEDETVWRPAFTATSDIPYNYALQEANFIHFEGLTKSERTYLANSLTQKIKEWFFSEDFHWQNLLSLLLRLMSNPNKMMHLVWDQVKYAFLRAKNNRSKIQRSRWKGLVDWMEFPSRLTMESFCYRLSLELFYGKSVSCSHVNQP